MTIRLLLACSLNSQFYENGSGYNTCRRGIEK